MQLLAYVLQAAGHVLLLDWTTSKQFLSHFYWMLWWLATKLVQSEADREIEAFPVRNFHLNVEQPSPSQSSVATKRPSSSQSSVATQRPSNRPARSLRSDRARAKDRSLRSDRVIVPLGRYVATELEPKLGRYVATERSSRSVAT
ncbi:hypothetical protein DY000_02041340 [Brassica cretica]|uniref:Uncharacterized protein n=1 Tax=Brassica cretica TaxID=69181 RepID=A0ABQ7BGP8_BRACR|nr:hypothetical protein DY000_02041340 [Brassica cretica]